MSSKHEAQSTTVFAYQASSSITHRLTVFYTLSALAILAVTTSFLFYALVSSLGAEDTRFLLDKIHDLRSILKERPDDRTALVEEINEGGDFQFIKHFSRLLSADGQILMETQDRNMSLPVSFFPPPLEADQQPKTALKQHSADGRTYLLLSAWASVTKPDLPRVLIQAALDVSAEEEIVNRYRKKVIAVLVIGILVSAGAGMLIARRGMRPLGEITKVIQRIRATQLNARVTPSRWPRELTALATSFDEMLIRLEDSFTRLSQFSSDLAHELRTPINNLMGEAEVALAKPRTPQEYEQILESSLEEYTRLSHMIESLLFLAKAESTDIRIERIVFDPVKEVEAVLEYYDALREEREIEILRSGTASLNADPLLFRRVISNILSNALRYTPPGGKISIAIKEIVDRAVNVTIRDTGIGIAPDELSKIFSRFYRSRGAKLFDAKGTGLGLAIVKSIMDLHGGTVDIQSEPSKGTAVTLFFPLFPDPKITEM